MTPRFLLPGLCLALALVFPVLAGCQGSETTTAPSNEQQASTETGAPSANGAASAQDEAQQIFGSRCATCHGQEGKGDGPGSALLNPKPRNFHDKDWQKQVTDKEMEQAILYGGAAVGKSPKMASNPDLQAKPEVVKALITKVRDFGKD